jgi:biotin carboxyl carrier protein
MPTVFSPIPGTVVRVLIATGARVERDDELVVIDSMKIESPITSDHAGVVESVSVDVGDTVNDGDVLLVIRSDG